MSKANAAVRLCLTTLALLVALPLSGASAAVIGNVSNESQLLARANSAASEGHTVYVREGSYGKVDFSGISRNGLVTFKAYPGESPVLGGAIIRDTDRLRFEGIRFTQGIDIQPGTNRGVQFVNNNIGGFQGNAFNVREGTENLVIQGNYIHDLTRGSQFAGYAIRIAASYGPVTGTVIRGNTIARTQEDGIMLVSQVRDTLIEDNLVTGVFPSGGSHADPLMLENAYGITVRDNRFIGNSQPVYFNDGVTGLNFTNNLIVKGDNWCIQMGAIGSDAADGVRNATIRFNTLWDCDFGGLLVRGAGSGNTVTNNVLQTLSGERMGSQFATEDYNLIGGGTRLGAHDRACCASFVNRSANDYHLRAGSLPFAAGWDWRAPPVASPAAPAANAAGTAGAPRKLKLRLAIKPRRVVVGKKRRFRFLLVYTSGKATFPIPAARIRFGSKKLKTGRYGEAIIKRRFRHRGRVRVKVRVRGLGRVRTYIRVVRRKR